MRPPAPKRFRFDAVCGPDSSQDEVFAQARPLIDAALGGASACVLAYGQTGSGKTYTMAGTPSAPGVVPRALERLYEAIDASPSTEWHVTITFVELYNDGWRDLLAPSSQPNQRLLPAQAEAVRREQSAIHLREVKSHVRGAPPAWRLEGSATFRTPVSSLAQLQELVAYGHRARAVGETRYNERSSRSHAVLSIHIDSKPLGATVVRTGKLLLVDLAGSERLKKTESQGVRLREALHINTSLTALGKVIMSLDPTSASPHLRYVVCGHNEDVRRDKDGCPS
jgi:kinesin family protein C2/C3